MDQLLDDVAKGKLAPIYVLSSEHPILIERVLGAIKDAVVPPAARGFNYDVVEGKPTGSKIVALAQTLPMMAARRLIYVRDISALPADEAEPLLAYLDKPNPTTVIAAVASKLDKRLKLFAQLTKKGYVHTLEAPRQLAPWVRAEAKARGVAIDGPAVQRLVDTVGDDLSRLALAVEQLGLFVAGPSDRGAGERAVTTDDVDELIADTRERSVFELTDSLGLADGPRALAAASRLCDQRESAVGVVVMLARHVRNLAQLHALRAAGVPRQAWVGKIGVPPFILDKLIAQARNYTPEALATATIRLANADRALKGDITLTAADGYTGPMVKALGRDLAERAILEHAIATIVATADR